MKCIKVKCLTKWGRRVLKTKYCGAVIVAAGTASRMGGIDKVMAPIGGEPMIKRTARAFQNCDVIREIVIVTRPDLIDKIKTLCASFDKVKAVVAGGADRAESVNNGLKALSSKVRLAAIHDGARPLITQEVIDRAVRTAHTYAAAAPGVPVKDTVKIVQGGVVVETPDRSTLQAIQTPQVFDFDLLRGAMKKVEMDKLEITDDCSAVELLGFKVKTVEGDERNLKVTTPLDLKLAEMLMEDMV
jgi:2-C-methyl-D-erythritol 4-phosphate cytidylyltransferase